MEHSRVSALRVIRFKADQSVKPTIFSDNSGLLFSTLGARITEHEAMNPGQSKPLVHSCHLTQIVHGFLPVTCKLALFTCHFFHHNQKIVSWRWGNGNVHGHCESRLLLGGWTGVVGPSFGQIFHVQVSTQIIFRLVCTDDQIHIL